MILERLEVENVRNIDSATLELGPGLNVLAGPNGAGKTAILEGVHILFRGHSFRSRSVQSIVRRGADSLTVRARLTDPHVGSTRVAVSKDRQRTTLLRRDGENVVQTSAIAELVPLQLFLPNLADLVFGPPSERRQWLDWGTFHVKPTYLATLRNYLRALRQRNAALKNRDSQPLAIWTAQVAELGEAVGRARGDYLADLLDEFVARMAQLDPDLHVALSYDPGWSGESLLEELRLRESREVRLGATQVGPHRGDVLITTTLRSQAGSPGSQGVGTLGSQGGIGDEHALSASRTLSRGQGKTVASAMRLAQATRLSATESRKTLFLIDDVGAELDRAHSQRFFEALDATGCQILATTAQGNLSRSENWAVFESARGERAVRMFHVKHGRIEGLKLGN